MKLANRSIVILGSMLAATTLAGAADPPRDTPAGTPAHNKVRSDDRIIDGTVHTQTWSNANAKRAADYMRQNNVQLEDAIDTAEGHIDGGKAIDARWRQGVGGAAGAMVLDVTVVGKDGNIMVVGIDGATGKVTSSQLLTDGVRDPASASMHSAILKASDFKGRDVVNAANEKIADIDDLAIDASRGRVAYAVIDLTGGVNRLVVVPWSALSHNAETCTLNLPAGVVLDSAPRFEPRSWSVMTTDEFARPLADYYRAPMYGRDGAVPADRPFTIVKLSDVLGTDVRSTSDQDLGDIEDLALDGAGNINYAALSFGGFLGFNDKLFAVPWDALSMPVDGKVTLAVDQERLKGAPGFDKKHWPTTADPQFASQVRDFYTRRSVGAPTDRP